MTLRDAGWRVDGETVAQELGLDFGLMLSELEALAMALIHLPTNGSGRKATSAMFEALATGRRQNERPDRGNLLVLAPGIDLGLAALLSTGRRYLALPAHIGAIGFGPSDREEERIWSILERSSGCATAGAILSEPGLTALYRARLELAGAAPATVPARDIIARARADRASEAARTVQHLWRLTARLASDTAIAFSAFGGVVLAGDLLVKARALLDPAAFHREFAAKSALQPRLRDVPLNVAASEDILLHGLAAVAADPSLFAIDYAQREWN